jgi:acylphosphatase
MTGSRSVRVCISGDVQGVGFRAWTERRAVALGLFGWVRNLEDGHVEAVFSGPDEAIEVMLAACREGPRHARVTNVEVLGEGEAGLRSFAIRY